MDFYQHKILALTEPAQSATSKAASDVSVFAQHDPYGLLMAMIGMGIVFAILLLLFVVFTNTPKLYTQEFKSWLNGLFTRKVKVAQSTLQESPDDKAKAPDMSGEVNAAIAAAIHLYRTEMHDYENTVLTISKVSRTYSPWSSKIYGLRNDPRQRTKYQG